MGFLDDIKKKFRSGNMSIKLIFTISFVFLSLLITNVIGGAISGEKNFVQAHLFPFLALPTDFTELLIRPWTLLTHMIIPPLDIFGLASNLILLYFSGQIFNTYFSEKQFLSLFLLGGLVGACTLLLLNNFLPGVYAAPYSMGPSAGIFALLFSACFYQAKRKISLFGTFEIEIQWIAIVIGTLEALQFFQSNSAGHLAHIAGGAFGILFLTNLRNGKDITSTFSTLIDKIIDLIKSKQGGKMKVHYSSKVKSMSDDEYNKSKKVNQEVIDAILDKISRHGYESLSAKEKDTLFRQSKNS